MRRYLDARVQAGCHGKRGMKMTITSADLRAIASGRAKAGKPKRSGKKNVVTPIAELVRLSAEMPTGMIVIPVPPGVNHLFATVGKRRIPSREYKAFKENVASIAGMICYRPMLEGDVQVTLVVYRPRKAGDCDSTVKAAIDAFQGIAYANDSQVRRVVVEIDDDPLTPRAVFSVRNYVKGKP